MLEIEFETKEINSNKDRYPEMRRNWFTRRTAYDWLNGVLYLSLITIALLVILEVFTSFYSITVIPK